MVSVRCAAGTTDAPVSDVAAVSTRSASKPRPQVLPQIVLRTVHARSTSRRLRSSRSRSGIADSRTLRNAHRDADETGYAALTRQLAVSPSDFPPLGSSTVTAIGPSDGVTAGVGNQGRPCRTTIRSPS
jgi:hypothetical protein